METAPEAVTLAASLLVLVTMIGTFLLFRFHAKNSRGRATMMRAAGEQGKDFYQRMIALELMAVREKFEALEREERDQLGDIAIDLTTETEELYQDSGKSEPRAETPGSPT